jgi:hypothetical protein
MLVPPVRTTPPLRCGPTSPHVSTRGLCLYWHGPDQPVTIHGSRDFTITWDSQPAARVSPAVPFRSRLNVSF